MQMAQKQKFDPDKIIDYSKDYYKILEITPESLLDAHTTAERQQNARVLELAYRNVAKKAHPDFGGSAEAFKLIVQAHTVLSDPILKKIWESKGEFKPSMAGDGSIKVDWSNFGIYRKGTTADTVGYALFLKICQEKDKFGIIPAFHPIDEFDNYEWDWVISNVSSEDGRQYKLSLSLVHDENDVLRLTSGADIADSLPFKIYMCIPRASLYFLRSEEERFIYEDGSEDVLSGKLQGATYSDYNLIETTSFDKAIEYIESGQLLSDLGKLRDGSLIKEQSARDVEAGQNAWLQKDKMNAIDGEVLRALMRLKSHEMIKDLKYNEDADQLLEKLPSKKKKG